MSTSNVTLDVDFLTSSDDKDGAISQMNFLYPYTKNMPVIRFNQMKIKIPEELDEVTEVAEVTEYTSSKKIVTETGSFSSPNVKNPTDYVYSAPIIEEAQYYPRVMTPIHMHSVQNDYMMQFSPMHQHQHQSQLVQESYYNDIEDVIQSGRLREFVETSNGSREFQKYLKKCSYEEVDQVLAACYDDLPDFIIHDYANYMFQGLVNACSPDQRIRVVNKIAPSLPTLSQNKKGTYSLQMLITIITTAQ